VKRAKEVMNQLSARYPDDVAIRQHAEADLEITDKEAKQVIFKEPEARALGSLLSERPADQAQQADLQQQPGLPSPTIASPKKITVQLQVCLRSDIQEAITELEAAGFQRDPDVLDTWFSSALWPHSTLGWPGPALPGQPPGPQNPEWAQMRFYYPTSVLVTSRDIITLWVARMVITGLYNVGQVPFGHVYIHAKILDGFGETMNKTKGNGIDPL